MSKLVFRFDDYRLDVPARSLSRAGSQITISPRLFEILKLLTENAGEVVSKAQLAREVWKEASITDNSIDKQISLLRKILGVRTTGEPFIETAARQGYRLLGAVAVETIPEAVEPLPVAVETVPEVVDTVPVAVEPLPEAVEPIAVAVETIPEAGETIPATVEPIPDGVIRGSHVRSAAIAIFAGAVLSGLFFVLHDSQAAKVLPTSRRDLIAVLPLHNLTSRQDFEWLSTGIEEMLTADVTVTGRLQPASPVEMAEIAAELRSQRGPRLESDSELVRIGTRSGVDLVVTGTFAALGPDLRVDAKIFDVTRKRIIASASEIGPTKDLFEVVARVGRSLAGKLDDRERSAVESAQTRASAPPDSADNRAYYEALEKLRAGDPLSASRLLEVVASRNPGFAPAHSALSEALMIIGYQTRAVEEARKARDSAAGLKREQVLAIEGQYSVATGDWSRAVRTFSSLCSFFPDNTDYALKLANALAKQGNKEEAYGAIAELRKRSARPMEGINIDLAEAGIAELFSDYDREQRIGEGIEVKAKRLGAPLQRARAELMESWSLDNLGKLVEAEAKAQDAQGVFASLGDKGSEAHAWKNLGDVYIDQGKLPLATTAYQRAIATFRELGWVSGQAVGLNNLAYVLNDEGDLAGAERMFGEALTIARTTGDLRLTALVLNGVAIILRRRGNFEGAKQAYEEAASIHGTLGDTGRLGTVVNNLAVVLMASGDLTGARKTFQEALKLFESTGRMTDVGLCLGNLGNLALLEGNLPEAEQMFRRDIKVNEKVAQVKRDAYELQGLGEVSYLKNDLSSARKFLQQSLDKRLAIQEGGTAAESRLALARVDLEQGRLSEADTEATLARDEYGKEKQNNLLGESEGLLARVLAAESRIKDAGASAAEAQRLSQAIEDRTSLAQIRVDLGKAYADLGRRSEARENLKLALRDSEQHHFVVYKLEAQTELAKLDLESGNPSARGSLTQISNQAQTRGLMLIASRAKTPVTMASGKHSP